MKNTVVEWKNENNYVAHMSCGEYTITSNAKDSESFKPPELILASLGTCAGLFLKPVLKEKGLDWKDFKVSVKGEKAKPPRLFKTINMHYEIKGDISKEQLEESIEESHKRCLVAQTLNPNIEIKSTFEIL